MEKRENSLTFEGSDDWIKEPRAFSTTSPPAIHPGALIWVGRPSANRCRDLKETWRNGIGQSETPGRSRLGIPGNMRSNRVGARQKQRAPSDRMGDGGFPFRVPRVIGVRASNKSRATRGAGGSENSSFLRKRDAEWSCYHRSRMPNKRMTLR